MKREVATGGEGASSVKFDLQPVQTRILMPIKGTGSDKKGNFMHAIEEEKPMLALPPSESPERITAKAIVALPQTTNGHH